MAGIILVAAEMTSKSCVDMRAVAWAVIDSAKQDRGKQPGKRQKAGRGRN